MVRQDKIAYLITGFTSTGLKPIYPNEPLVELFIKIILSIGTNNQLRDIAFKNIKCDFIDYEDILKSKRSKLKNSIKISRFTNKKSTTIIEFLKWSKNNFDNFNLKPIINWEYDKIYDELTSINGIGIKLVSSLICFGLRGNSFPVDVHVHRIITRIGITLCYKSPDKVFKIIKPFIPVGKEYFLHAHIINYGKEVCRKLNPKCDYCMFNKHCDFFQKKNEWAENKNSV